MRAELAARFEAERVPRYTSYPTAPHFAPDVGPAEHAAWLAATPAGAPVSLYLHVPFCRQLCWYCGCHTTVTRDRARAEAYARALEREVDLVRRHLPSPRVATSHVHWGGGTPTAVGAAALRRISERLRAAFDLLPGAEVAIELDPRATDGELLDALAGIGVTRASLGVQSLDPAVQEAVNRVQPLPLVAATAAGLRERGIRDLNVDLLYGLPRQTAESAAESARLVAGLEPARVAVFGYAHVPELIKRQRAIDAASLPDAAQRAAQQEAVAEVLLGAGYVAVGLDHFARPDDPLAVAAGRGTLRRNFQGYTTDAAETLIGLGCSSISTFAQGYVQNHADLARWREAVAGGRLPTARGVALRPEDRLRREVIEAIMCRGEVDLAEVAARHGAPPSACEPDPERFALVARLGVAAREGSVVRVGPAHRPLLRIVAAAFDARLRPGGGRHAAAAAAV